MMLSPDTDHAAAGWSACSDEARQPADSIGRRASVGGVLGGIALKDSEARDLIALIYQHSGIVLTRDKKSLISSRLNKRLRSIGAAFVPQIPGLPAKFAGE